MILGEVNEKNVHKHTEVYNSLFQIPSFPKDIMISRRDNQGTNTFIVMTLSFTVMTTLKSFFLFNSVSY